MDPKNIESLIFDIDGTLWDSRALVAEGYNVQLKKEGREDLFVTAEDFKPLFGKINPDIADVIFAPLPPQERYALIDRCAAYQDVYMQQHPCQVGYPGVKETLEQLAKNHRLFLVSNGPVGYPQLCLKKLGLEHLFSGTLCHGETGVPKWESIRILMERYDIHSACYIGDTQGDYESTLAAGIPFVWAAYGFGTPTGYDAKVDNFPQLAELF